MEHFKNIGATTPTKLKLCGPEHFRELLPFAKTRPSLERKALEKLLGMMDENNAFRQQQLQQLEEKHKKSKELLQSLKELQKEQKTRHDEAVKKIENDLCETLNVSSEDLIPPNADLETLLKELEVHKTKLSGTLAQRSDMSTVELIEHVSGGHMLRGIKLDGSKSKNILLRAHECITFRGAKAQAKTESKTFTSAHEEVSFTKNMYKFGIEGGSAGFTVAAARANESQESHKHEQQSTYLSTLKTSILPLASCCFDDDDLILSQHALSALKSIEKLILAKPEIDVRIACEDFFDKYGAYVNRGPYTLGGIYWWKALSEGFNETKTDELKAIHSASLSGFSYMSVGATNIGYDTGKCKGKNTKNHQKDVQVTNEQLGGPPEVTSLPQWKDGLIASNSTWNIIGQDTDLIYIWEILELNHSKNFEDVQRLSQLLSRSLERNKVWQKNETLLKRVKIWNHSKDESMCIDHLSELVQEKNSLGTNSQNQWCEFHLKQLPIQYYLRWVVNIAKSKQCSSSEAIRSIMQQVLEYKELVQVLHFPDHKHICEWLYPVDQEVKLNIDATTCTDMPSFLSFLQNLIKHIHFDEVRGYQTQQSPLELVTAAMKFLQANYLQEGSCYHKLLLLTLLVPLNYDCERCYFRLSELSIKNLECLYTKLSEALEINHEDDLHAQAYLFLLALNSAGEVDDLSGHIRYLASKIGNLETTINDALLSCQHQSEFDFHKLRLILEEILKKQQPIIPANTFDQLEEDDLRFKPLEPIQNENVANSKYEQFLADLKFVKYFPQKLTLREALVIDCNGLASKESTTDPHQLLPIILEKIKMSNYNCREVLLYGKTSMLKEKEEKVDDIEDGFNDDDDDYSNSDISEDDIEVLVHPMDSLLALILCSDNFLRQDLYIKLNNFQLAVPLLLPDPVSGTVTFPLWALRSIVRSWKCKVPESQSNESYKGRIVDCNAPIVSFIRFSHPGSYSKSEILNRVIDGKKSFFFNYYCEGNSAERKFADGLVEATWYLPSGEDSDRYNDVITFLNLRGNAGEHEKQLDFLSAQSSLLFIFLSNEDVEKYIDKIKCFVSTEGKVVFLCSESNQKILKRVLPRCTVSLLNKAPAAIVKSIRNKIISQTSLKQKQLFELQCDVFGIVTDENIPPCQCGKESALKIMEAIKHISKSKVKDQVVPLQGSELWREWASLNKIQKRMKSEDMGQVGPEEFNKSKRKKKEDIRKKQYEKANEPSFVMSVFKSALVNQDSETRAYFLQWLKFYLDDRSSKVLPELKQECDILQERLSNKLVANKREEEDIKKELMKKDKDLIDASFGVEHFFRELGQIYECTMEMENEVEQSMLKEVKLFPKIAAHLLLNGHPLELVDGDAAHIPMKWIAAVIHGIKLLIKNSKMLVLSVLGVQSAGKSTLLNTLFGVRFAVGGGRCTRGAYLQLMKLNSTASSEVKCDYMLIIDTEGLQALELDPQTTQQHDNELATLVVGLADVTIINIRTELPGNISDVLQTSVHAFLRMKQVDLKPSCQFVRYNVTDGADIQQFQQTLDDMIVLATKAEHCEGQYTRFNDVIVFNNKTDVQDFPSLWEGNPPMAPVNPGYCEAAQKLKSKFIEMCKSPDSFCSIDEFETRVTKLWNAVLEENYVFSFKNTRELEAYAAVDGEYSKWSYRLKSFVLVWESNAQKKLSPESCKDNEVKIVKGELVENITQTLDSEFVKIMQDFEKFFKESSHAQTMVQWKYRYEKKLRTIKEEHKMEASKICTNLIQSRHAKKKHDELKRSLRNEINQHIEALVSKMNIGRELTEEELFKAGETFTENWNKWMDAFKREYPPLEKLNLDSQILLCLKKDCQLEQYDSLINVEVNKLPLKSRGKFLHQLLIDLTRHLNFGLIAQHTYTVQSRQKDLDIAQDVTKHIISIVEAYFSQCHISYVNASARVKFIIPHIMREIDDFDNQEGENFTFTSEYRIDIILGIAGYALQLFTTQQDEAIYNHPLTYLESLTSAYSLSFITKCTATAHEKNSAMCLAELVIKQLKLSLQDGLVISLADDIRLRNPVFASKQTLKGNILLGLLKDRDFESYATYLTNISQSYLQWIEGYIDEHCKNNGLKIVELVEPLIGNAITAIVSAANYAYASSTGITQWLTVFQTHLKEKLLVNEEELYELVQLQENSDLKVFTDEFIAVITKYKTEYLADFQKLERSTVIDFITVVNKAAENVHNSVAGCCEQCPFCKEQCEMTDSMHERDHVCTLHRPLCLGGYRDDTSGKMELDTCTQRVKSWKMFKNPNTKKKWVWYSNYREIYPRWNIPKESDGTTAPYWKWFIAQYKQGIVLKFGMSKDVTPIPKDWMFLTQKDAERDIKKRYKL